MFNIKQLIPSGICLKCQGCCRFSEEDSIYQPAILNEEAKLILKNEAIAPSKKIRSLFFNSHYYCFFFDRENNCCKIYQGRPFECKLYPFLINKTKDGAYLAVDLKCPFTKDKWDNKEFKDYINYLISFLGLPVVSSALKRSPHTFTDYSHDEKIKNLAALVF